MSLYPVHSFPPDRVAALNDLGRQLTYGDLGAIAEQFEPRVESRRVGLVLTENSLDCLAGCVALMNCGVVPLLIDVASDQTIAEQLVDLYTPEYVYAPEGIETRLSGYSRVLDHGTYRLSARRGQLPDIVHPDLALLLSTSGSTGSPKLVRQSSVNLRSNGQAIVEYLGIRPTDRPITSLPMHYTYGYSVINSHLMAGATLLMTDHSVMEKAFWEFMDGYGATSFAGVPYTYVMLQRLRFTRMNLPQLATMTQAGGKMATPLIKEFAEYALERGINFFVMYGQTEATARMSYVPADQALDKAGSIGIAVPGGEFFLVDDDHHLVQETSREGQLGYRGPNVTMGYAVTRSDLSKGDERGGVLLTGDIAFRDEDGFYYVTGRLSRFVKVFGKRVSLDDIEQLSLAVVREAACLGVDDKVSVWITEPDKQEQLRQFLADRTGIHPSAYSVRASGSLPRTAAGKVDYQRLSLGSSA